MTRIKATPAEIEITAIVGELVHDGFMDLSTDDIIALEEQSHASYRRIADLFCAWALALVTRRLEERAEVDGEAMASIRAAAEMADWDAASDEALVDFERAEETRETRARIYGATTETGVIDFGMCPP